MWQGSITMTAIDRTIYRRMKRSYTTKELIEAYTPTEEERRFVDTMTRSQQHQLNLMLWIKLFRCLGYFPSVDEIPPAVVPMFAKHSLFQKSCFLLMTIHARSIV